MPHSIGTTELFLIAMIVIFSLPFLIWRLGRTEYFAPLVVVQIIAGILLGPGVLGQFLPDYYNFLFTKDVIQSLNGVAWWAVMLFVFIAGIELDLKQAWIHRGETMLTAGLAMGAPMLLGGVVAICLLEWQSGWIGKNGSNWQFVAGIGMSCAVTALPILVLFLEKIDILRRPLGQRILRYASMDDIAIWAVLALILLDWGRIGRQIAFVVGFVIIGYGFRQFLWRIRESDRWYASLIWLPVVGFCADWAGLHFMVGAFLAGTVITCDSLDQRTMDTFRFCVLLALMPVFFLVTGLRTNWEVGGEAVFLAAAAFLVAAVVGKLAGVHLAGRLLGWSRVEASVIGWLLQTKALIMIIFANVLLDKQLITSDAFTALLLMAIASTMLTIPMVSPKLANLRTSGAIDAGMLSDR